MTTEPNKMNLEIRHICGYFPYGLKVLCYQRVRSLHGLSQDMAYLFYNGLRTYTLKEFKPILRPLSSMTDDEYNELEQLNCTYTTPYVSEIINTINWYYSKHFDIHSLIENDLALDLNTLK